MGLERWVGLEGMVRTQDGHVHDDGGLNAPVGENKRLVIIFGCCRCTLVNRRTSLDVELRPIRAKLVAVPLLLVTGFRLS